jgi:hypothetical protein
MFYNNIFSEPIASVRIAGVRHGKINAFLWYTKSESSFPTSKSLQ